MLRANLETSRNWQEIDLLRGFACALMIINHVGYALSSTAALNKPSVAWPVFLGSFAPVLFFFVTGVGTGVRPESKRNWTSVLTKACILFLADFLLRWQSGTWFGIDFLGFIAISMLVLHVVSGTKSPARWAAIAFSLVLILRFGVGPIVKHAVSTGSFANLVGNLLGISSAANISYPMCPWLAYPLMGFVLGSLLRKHSEKIASSVVTIAIGSVVVLACTGAVATAMALKGWPVFRWGSMSLAFFVASISCISSSVLLVLALCRLPINRSLIRWLSMRGVSSLAVVPLHYGAIHIAKPLAPQENWPGYYLVSVCIILIVFIVAKAIKRLAESFAKLPTSAAPWALCAFLASLAIVLVLSRYGGPSILVSASVVGQIAFCFLLVNPWPAQFRLAGTRVVRA